MTYRMGQDLGSGRMYQERAKAGIENTRLYDYTVRKPYKGWAVAGGILGFLAGGPIGLLLGATVFGSVGYGGNKLYREASPVIARAQAAGA